MEHRKWEQCELLGVIGKAGFHIFDKTHGYCLYSDPNLGYLQTNSGLEPDRTHFRQLFRFADDEGEILMT